MNDVAWNVHRCSRIRKRTSAVEEEEAEEFVNKFVEVDGVIPNDSIKLIMSIWLHNK